MSFSICYHQSIPRSAHDVSITVGGNYHYDSMFVDGRSLGDVSWVYVMPVPVGPLIRRSPPVHLDGLIRSEPYRDPDGSLVEAGSIEQFVPTLGHRRLTMIPVLEDGKIVKATGYKTVPGLAEYSYKWRVYHEKTVTRTKHWKYRGKWYSKEKSKTYSWYTTHERVVRYHDSVMMLPRKAVRHLNHCDHSKVHGDLWLSAADLGFDSLTESGVQFQSTWPAAARPPIFEPATGIIPKEIMDLPLDRNLLKGRRVRVLPKLYKCFVARNNGEAPLQDIITPCMAGMFYIGPSYFDHDRRYVGTAHVYAIIAPERSVRNPGDPFFGSIRFIYWLDNPQAMFRYSLWQTPSFRTELPISHDKAIYEECIRRCWSRHGSTTTWDKLALTHSLTTAEDPRVEFNSKELLEVAYARLWRAVLPENMENVYKQTIGHAGQEALLNTKVLNINSIMYTKDFTTLRELCGSYADLLRKGVNPGTVSGAYLASHYGVRLTVQDTREILERVRRELEQDSGAYQYSRSTHKVSVQGPAGKVDVTGTVSVLFTLVDGRTLQFLSDLARWDFLPTPRVIWDMIPYSFVLDWIVPIGGVLEQWDRLITEGTIYQKRCCWSQKTVAELDAALLVPALLKTGTQLYGCSEGTTLVGYRRAYQRYAPSPDALLDLLDISPSWSSSRAYEISALTIQKMGPT